VKAIIAVLTDASNLGFKNLRAVESTSLSSKPEPVKCLRGKLSQSEPLASSSSMFRGIDEYLVIFDCEMR
jgi:hypothetical protein